MIKVRQEVRVYEVDGNECALASEQEPLIVESHWNRDSLIRFRRGNQDFTCSLHDIQAAVLNAGRTAK